MSFLLRYDMMTDQSDAKTADEETGRLTVTAVSYTHLDVYKRQATATTAATSTSHTCEAFPPPLFAVYFSRETGGNNSE